MGTLNTTSKQFISSGAANTDFRAIVQLWHDFFGTTCGFTQATDTGQIDPSTVNFPGSNNTDAGEEIWYFTDSLQSTRPVAFRIVYGRGQDAGDWRIKVSISMSVTNGSKVFLGRESGTTTQTFALAGTRTNTDTTLYKVVGSGNGSRFVICFFPNTASTPHGRWFYMERTREADGDFTGEGVTSSIFQGTTIDNNLSTEIQFQWDPVYQPAWKNTSQSGHGRVNYMRVQGMGGAGVGATPRLNNDTVSTLAEGKVFAFPFYPGRPGWKYPITAVMTMYITDWPMDFSTVTIPFYGANRTYMPLGPFMVAQQQFGGETNVGYLMQFESF